MNREQCYIQIRLQDLVAKLSGASPKYLDDAQSLSLDASESYNPNEKDQKKKLLYTWECNIANDKKCMKFTTEGKIIKQIIATQ